MLYTNLNHIETAEQHNKVIGENENVMIVCGRMGTLSIPVYRIVTEIEDDYSHVKFFDMEYDNPESQIIRKLMEEQGLAGIPFIVYYRNGQLLKATSGIQSKEQVTTILNEYFETTVHA